MLIEIDSLPGPAQATAFDITTTVAGGSLATGSLDQKLNTLHHPTSGAASFSTDGTVVLSPAHPTGFAYIGAIKCEDVQIPIVNIQQELTVTLTVRQTNNSSNTKQVSFKIRKPPVVLIHGFDSDRTTWNDGKPEGYRSQFLNILAQSRHLSDTSASDNFVVRINYGVDTTSTTDPKLRNRTGSFTSLVQDLDLVLSRQIETTQIPGIEAIGTYKDWAMTRYDLICHSQGGVLARMLCASPTAGNPMPFGISNRFKSERNANRGRFRRIITIGSPQNGTRLEYYASKLGSNIQVGGSAYDAFLAFLRSFTASLVQEKFNPFGNQVAQLNNSANAIDPGAKFHIIRGAVTTIPPIFTAFYLSGARLNTVLPRGSDAVVDFDSQTASQSGMAVDTVFGVSHSGPEQYFGVQPGSTETASTGVAAEAIGFLDGPGPNVFAPFRLPTLLSQNERAAIDAVVPGLDVSNILHVGALGSSSTEIASAAQGPNHFDPQTW